MKTALKVIGLGLTVAGLTLSAIRLFNRLCEAYSKLLFKDDPDEYYSWPV